MLIDEKEEKKVSDLFEKMKVVDSLRIEKNEIEKLTKQYTEDLSKLKKDIELSEKELKEIFVMKKEVKKEKMIILDEKSSQLSKELKEINHMREDTEKKKVEFADIIADTMKIKVINESAKTANERIAKALEIRELELNDREHKVKDGEIGLKKERASIVLDKDFLCAKSEKLETQRIDIESRMEVLQESENNIGSNEKDIMVKQEELNKLLKDTIDEKNSYLDNKKRLDEVAVGLIDQEANFIKREKQIKLKEVTYSESMKDLEIKTMEIQIEQKRISKKKKELILKDQLSR